MEYIKTYLEQIATISVLVNFLFAAFMYFNKKSHDKELKQLQHSFNLDLERRKQVFSLKVAQYERYVGILDEFGRKYQSELFSRMQPVFQQYMNSMLNAEDESDKNTAIGAFSAEVMGIMNESSKEYFKLKAESRSLKLTASDELIQIFSELEDLVKMCMDASQELIKQLPVLIMSGDEAVIAFKREELERHGEEIQKKSSELEWQMRLELREM